MVLLINTQKCMARLTKDPKKQCGNKKKAGLDYCGKHCKSNNLIRIDQEYFAPIKNKNATKITYNDMLQNNFNIKKFSEKNINHTLNKLYHNYCSSNKEASFVDLINILRIIDNYSNNITQIIKLQSFFRGQQLRIVNKLRGPAYLNRFCSNNDKEFLTFQNVSDISNSKFYSLKDKKGFVYSFHLDSIKYIFENDRKNPYTRETLTVSQLETISKLVKLDKSPPQNYSIVNTDPYLKMKERCIMAFQRMDELELYTQAKWFLNLNTLRLRKLYIELEDIWNYRAMLTDEFKKKYTKSGKAFSLNIGQINKLNDKIILQNIILTEINKLINEGQTKEDCVTAAYWVLTALTTVSHDAASGYPHLVYTQAS